MEYIIHGREPAAFFRFFEEISAIPRPSYHESGIADYLTAFAKARGLEYWRDELNNVLIKMPATRGQEHRAPILFQGHSDMVCEKNADVEHDFLKDPLDLWVDGDLLRAKGTTLGADDGVAVALMLTLLNGELAEHPAIECLFTTAEEVGLNGAHGFDYGLLRARRMVNVDSELLGKITCGCAGGVRSDLHLPLKTEPFKGTAMRVAIGGLMGGHSGENIDCGRANANKLMGRLLAALLPACDFRLISVEGGSKDNAIPRESEALLAVSDFDEAESVLSEEAALIASELVSEDRGFSLTVEDAEQTAVVFSKESTVRAISVLAAIPNGVFEMNRSIPGLVEYSRNLGVVRTEDDAIDFVFASRSSIESRLDASTRELDAVAAAIGGETKHYNRYPGWSYAPKSDLREAYLKAYRDVTGEEASVNVIHAGLECGIIYSRVPDMDIISIAPTLHDLHSPDESLDLGTVEVFWRTIVRLIELL
ncbi:MAG: aminoacyl-histidine dipeptidase [Clostridia bacterium]|nr:aminoacyl-histidine dipeptidase [Clostridia bacterium]